VATMALMYIMPQLATWLPDYLYGTVDTSAPVAVDAPPEGGFGEEETIK